MPDRLQLFVSAGPDLESERDTVGQVVAKLPLSIGWNVKRTPPQGEPLAVTLENIRRAHFFIMILGVDITAPVGAEWDAARRVGLPILAYLKEVTRTPAAMIFVRDSRILWTPFRTHEELARRVEADLAWGLLDRATELGLTIADWENLNALLKRSEAAKPTSAEEGAREPAGAEGGGVILAPGRDLPSGGILIEPN
jgi:hypothetical protein